MKKLLIFLLTTFLLPLVLFGQNSTENNTQVNQNYTFGLSQSTSMSIYLDPLGYNKNLINSATTQTIDKDSYKLGPQDVVSLEIKGLVNLFARGLTISPQGYIFIPDIGKFSIGNLTISEAESEIKRILQENFKQTELGFFNLDFARPVFITSNTPIAQKINKPLPGLTHLADFLLSQGDILKDFYAFNGYDLRNVRINRDGTTSTYDIIDFIMTGDQSQNPMLISGDHLELDQLNRYLDRVIISGAVENPSILSYRQGDTVSNLIALSGGRSNHGSINEVELVYADGRRETILGENDGFKMEVPANSHIIVPENKKPIFASVWIDGEILQPGNYRIEQGETTVSDIITIAGGFSNQALTRAITVIRGGTFVSDAINLNQELLKRTSNQVLEGFEYLNNESAISGNRLFTSVEPGNESSLVLLDGDRIIVPTNPQSVLVFGQVNTPGHFTYDIGKSIDQYISIAGGYALAADKKRVFIIKAGTRSWYKPEDTSLQSGDYIYVDREPYIDYANQQRIEAEDTRLLLQQISIGLTAISTALLLVNFFQK